MIRDVSQRLYLYGWLSRFYQKIKLADYDSTDLSNIQCKQIKNAVFLI